MFFVPTAKISQTFQNDTFIALKIHDIPGED